jgi:transposase
LFPAALEDYVAEDNLVRVVDAFVDGLDLGKLGFGRISPQERGRPCYHPATLLKIYIYGYLERSLAKQNDPCIDFLYRVLVADD